MGCLRTHTCGELRASHIGSDVILSGWLYRKRDHGNLLFVDLRDRYGIVQLVFDEMTDSKIFELISKLRLESVIRIRGKVISREEGTVNKLIDTGEIEVRVLEIFIESESDFLPFSIAVDSDYPEALRLKHRYLDLRREKVFKNIVMRSEIIHYLRVKMHELGFIEVQTPILTASSPEGARDYLVPSRLHKGKFYALPQAPQQFKQLLMVAGFDKYFQIAPCFRDEDARADRSIGDFYQLDIEMSFVTQEEIFAIVKDVILGVFSKFSQKVIHEDFPIITYDDAMLSYASDKPDLRNPIIIRDVTDVFVGSDFNLFVKNIEREMSVRAIPAPGAGKMPRSFFDKILAHAQLLGAKGLAYIVFNESEPSGPIVKFLDQGRINKIIEICNLGSNDAVFFSSAPMNEMIKVLDGVRQFLGKELNLVEENVFKFCWITDFPYFEIGSDGKLQFSHNPFSMPKSDLTGNSINELLKIRAYQYDIVCNGIELSSGAIRNHNIDLLLKAFELTGYSRDEVECKFPGITSAFRYGVPPHGGIAPGIDRMVMLITGESNIREVICFPFNQAGEDLMMNAPSMVSDNMLKDLGLRCIPE